MPTAAKLIAAILFAVLSWLVTEQVKLVLPGEGRGMDLLSPINALIGGAMGWRIMGLRAGDGFTPAVGFGLTTVFATFFWALLLWSGYEMIKRSVAGRYRDPIQALEGMGDLLLDYAIMVVTPTIVGWAVLGSFICAMITEYFSRRWS